MGSHQSNQKNTQSHSRTSAPRTTIPRPPIRRLTFFITASPITDEEYYDLVRSHAELRERYNQAFLQRAQEKARAGVRISTTETVRTETVNIPPSETNRSLGAQSNPIRVQTVPPDVHPDVHPDLRQPSTIINLERSRTPCSYSSSQLRNLTQQRKNVYPDCNETAAAVQKNPFVPENRTPSGNSQDNSDFVTINDTNRITSPVQFPNRSESADRRNRSSPGNKNDNLGCQTCKGNFRLKIYQCNNGHSSCSACHSKRVLCGQCRLDITNVRNTMLEEFVSQYKIPCPNAADGCCLVMKTLDMETHINKCPFGEIKCPVDGVCGICNWRGKSRQLADHFSNSHPAQVQADVDTEMLIINLNATNHTLYLVSMGPYNFIFHVKVCEMERKIFMAAQLFGTNVSASKWIYEIHVFDKRESRRKYQMIDICTSAFTPTSDVFQRCSCAILPLPYAKTFVNEGTLSYKFFIKQNKKDRPNGNVNRRGRGAYNRRN